MQYVQFLKPQTKKVKATFGWLVTRGRHSRLLCKHDLADFTQPQRGFVFWLESNQLQ